MPRLRTAAAVVLCLGLAACGDDGAPAAAPVAADGLSCAKLLALDEGVQEATILQASRRAEESPGSSLWVGTVRVFCDRRENRRAMMVDAFRDRVRAATPPPTTTPATTTPATTPPAGAKDLKSAARAAGCVLLDPRSEGADHTVDEVEYKNSNPPASGPHNPVPAEDGVYDPGDEPAKEHWVHTLEHGRVIVQYRPGTDDATIQKLVAVSQEPLKGSSDYHVLIMQNNTDMRYAVAAVAWTHVLGCPRMNDRVFDAIRAFRNAYTDKAPELIP